MTREEAMECIEAIHVQMFNSGNSKWTKACDMAIEALADNKPSRTWIAKNEYRRGWHDAITRALSEVMKIHVGNEIFDMVQKETLIGLGLSMDSALGAEPYSETEESYPEPDRPHGEWVCKGAVGNGTWCSSCDAHFSIFPNRYNFCPNCGFPMNEEALEILRKREGET